MAEIEQIKSWEKYITTERHSKRLKEQNTDQSFFEDTYTIPHIQDEDYITRTAFVSELENSVTPQVIANEPKMYTEAKNTNSQKASERISVTGNQWLKVLARQGIHPFRQTFKWMAFTRGEAWIYTPHNDYLMSRDKDWREQYPNILPVHFILYDPMVVFHDPAEEVDGKPTRVIVKFTRAVGDLRKSYPFWTNPNGHKDEDTVPFMLYFDKDTRYAEADKEPLFRDEERNFVNGDGRHVNPYEIVPFAHKYSGYGTQTNDLNPALLAYTRTRMIRDRVREDAAMATDFRYNQHEQAWPRRTILWPMDIAKPDDLLDEYSLDPDTFSILRVPQGVEPKVEESTAFGAEAYAYRDRVKAELNATHPMPVRGLASGTSGRQEDYLAAAALSMYDAPVSGNAQLWADALNNAFKICSIPILDVLPKNLRENDSESYSELRVEIRKDDLVARDRKIMAGNTLVNEGKRSIMTFLTQDMGMTQAEADEEFDEILAEKIMFQSPEILAFLGFKAAERSGMADELEAFRQANQGGKPITTSSKIGSEGGEKRRANIKTETGREQSDVSLSPYGVRSRSE